MITHNGSQNGSSKGQVAEVLTATTTLRIRPRKLTAPPRVAYIMSRFPKLTETFILYEMLAVAEQEVQVEIYPLQREKGSVMHPEAADLMPEVQFTPFVSAPILSANWRVFRRDPRAYASALAAALKGTWGSARYFGGAVAFFPKAVYLAERMADADIAHVHAHFASHPALVAFVIHRLSGIPFSFTAHGSDLHRDQHMLRQKLAEAAFAITISEYNRQFMIEACGEEMAQKISVLHCGVDTRLFRPRERAEGQATDLSPAQRLDVLCIGTLHEVKGQAHLIEAVGRLHERGVDVICHFLGDGPDRKALEAAARQAGIAEQVRFHGLQTREQILDWLKRADILVTPSVPSSDGRREGIPVVLIEAMASGLPVVASRLSGIPELVEDGRTGLLTPPGDAVALADALERLHRNGDLRARLGRAGREKVVSDFNLHKNAARLAQRFAHQTEQGVRKVQS